MSRRPTDHTAALDAARQRRDKLAEQRRKAEQLQRRLLDRIASAYGQIALARLGPHFGPERFDGLVAHALGLLDANPNLATEWAERGAETFRARPKSNGANGARPAPPANGDIQAPARGTDLLERLDPGPAPPQPHPQG